jgi:hypothetical protein
MCGLLGLFLSQISCIPECRLCLDANTLAMIHDIAEVHAEFLCADQKPLCLKLHGEMSNYHFSEQ